MTEKTSREIAENIRRKMIQYKGYYVYQWGWINPEGATEFHVDAFKMGKDNSLYYVNTLDIGHPANRIPKITLTQWVDLGFPDREGLGLDRTATPTVADIARVWKDRNSESEAA